MIPPRWRELAFAPPRAGGTTLGSARLRAEPEDFQVDEVLGFDPHGSGQHVLLRVRKRNANTEWVARELSRAARCRAHDVGYAGLKDRHAVTTQWFTVPAGQRPIPDWVGFAGEGYEVVEAHAHHRKLPRGALQANVFRLRLRDCTAAPHALDERVAAILRDGVPNYFGPQRFGREGSNLVAAQRVAEQRQPGAAAAERDNRGGRASGGRSGGGQGFVLSAARSLIFNAVLAARVQDRSWGRLEVGDVANLDGRGSVFPVDAIDESLVERCQTLDVHPTGVMWGAGSSLASGRVATLEQEVATEFAQLSDWLVAAGLRQERRALRLRVRDLRHEWDGQDCVLSFALAAGSFATVVVRELLDVQADAEDEVNAGREDR